MSEYLTVPVQLLIDSGATIDTQQVIDELFDYKMQEEERDMAKYREAFEIRVSPECTTETRDTQAALAEVLRENDKLV